jgi:hypothetical protein
LSGSPAPDAPAFELPALLPVPAPDALPPPAPALPAGESLDPHAVSETAAETKIELTTENPRAEHFTSQLCDSRVKIDHISGDFFRLEFSRFWAARGARNLAEIKGKRLWAPSRRATRFAPPGR